VYQDLRGTRRDVAGGFAVRRDGQVGFQVAKYDRSLPLVIDPSFVGYATYLAASMPTGIAVDHDGDAYIAGSINNPGFPGTQSGYTGTADAFVVKLDPTGSRLLYATYFGGTTGTTGASVIAIDAAGNAVITGQTLATDLPIQNGFQPASGGGTDAFVAKISTTGAGLLYSTYLGGTRTDIAAGLALTPAGNAYVCGTTASAGFPTKDAYQGALSGPSDAFVTVISTTSTGSASLLYSTFLGGTGNDNANAIAVDASGNFYVLGLIHIPIVNGYQDSSTDPKVLQVTITAFVPNGSSIFYSTFLHSDIQGVTAGNASESISSMIGNAITVDNQKNAYVTGVVEKDITQDAELLIADYRLLARFDCAEAGAKSLVFASASGGSPMNSRSGISITLDSWGNIVLGAKNDFDGFTTAGYPVIEKWSADGMNLISYLQYGGLSFEYPTGFAYGAEGSVYGIALANPAYPLATAGAFQATPIPNVGNGFMFKLGPNSTPLHLSWAGGDLLFQNVLDGSLVDWLMSGDKENSVAYLFPASPGRDWKLVGTADLNGDDVTDLLFQNQKTGDLAYWLMQVPIYPDTTPVATSIGFLAPKNPGANWNVVGMAYFNRDGFADILFRNSVTGQLYIWYMKGTTLISEAFVSPSDPGAGWNVAAVGDMNRDGQTDILFQNAENGDLYVWYLHDNTLISEGYLNPANPGPGWQAVSLVYLASASSSSPATPNILFQNVDTGLLAYWIMDGPNLVNYALPQPFDPGPNWRLVGPK
jgi:hypothetical protein